MQVRKQQLEFDIEQQYGFNRYKLLYIKQISNRIYKELYSISSEYIMRNVGLEETQTRIKIARRNINNLRYADDTTLMAKSEEELKSLLMKVKMESEKVGIHSLKAQHSENEDHGIRSHHFMGNRWGNNGNSVRLYFLGLQNHDR